MGTYVAFQAGEVSVLGERFVLQHELAGEKWSLQCEADAARRLGCSARARGKEQPNRFSPEPHKSAGRGLTRGTARG